MSACALAVRIIPKMLLGPATFSVTNRNGDRLFWVQEGLITTWIYPAPILQQARNIGQSNIRTIQATSSFRSQGEG